jgi:carboxymethylenebutenolidase
MTDEGGEERLISGLDGFAFAAWRRQAVDARRGGLVVVQEIFGVTPLIHDIARGFAQEGYETLAPSLFDRRAPAFRVGYDAEGVAAGRALSEATPWAEVAADLRAAVEALAPPVFLVGYCWGGTAAWLAACRVPGLSAVSSYYGRRIPELWDAAPACPVILHFGRRDASIPMSQVEALTERFPDLPIHLYDAGHGFASDRGSDFSPDPARLARLRTLQLFALHGGGRGEA